MYSSETIYEVGEIYASGMNEQMARHFGSIIQLRFDQVDGITSVVSPEGYPQKAENDHAKQQKPDKAI